MFQKSRNFKKSKGKATKLPISISAPKLNLQRLVVIRWLLFVGVAVGVLVVNTMLSAEIPTISLLTTLGFLALLNVATMIRLYQDWPLTELEFCAHIIADIIGITLIFYLFGGATNPFISYYLVPLTISAATLPWFYTILLALLSLGAYSLLLFFYHPIAVLEPKMTGDHLMSGSINPHTVGMWFNFLLSAVLISFFVVRMSAALKMREQQLAKQREDNLRDEQVLAVATLAAGTAHELGSPLTTMRLTIDEIIYEHQRDSELQRDLNSIKMQIQQCSSTLKKLVSQVAIDTKLEGESVLVAEYCKRIVEQWLLLRPDVMAQVKMPDQPIEVTCCFHPTVDQALVNIFNNAADASPGNVQVNMEWDEQKLEITINDAGEGIDSSIQEKLGQGFVSGKKAGLGMGVFLSNATINRYGGNLTFFTPDDGGTRTVIRLPLNPPHSKMNHEYRNS